MGVNKSAASFVHWNTSFDRVKRGQKACGIVGWIVVVRAHVGRRRLLGASVVCWRVDYQRMGGNDE